MLNRIVTYFDCFVPQIRFYVVEKSSGNVLPGKFFAPPAVILHHINAFEDNGIQYYNLCSLKHAAAYY